jgi:hypothetical protein
VPYVFESVRRAPKQLKHCGHPFLYFFPRRARAERPQGGDRSAKTFHARDPGEMKSIDRPGEVLVAFDVAPSLQDAGFEACRKDSPELLAQIQGVIDVGCRHASIRAGDSVAFSRDFERIGRT